MFVFVKNLVKSGLLLSAHSSASNNQIRCGLTVCKAVYDSVFYNAATRSHQSWKVLFHNSSMGTFIVDHVYLI